MMQGYLGGRKQLLEGLITHGVKGKVHRFRWWCIHNVLHSTIQLRLGLNAQAGPKYNKPFI